MGLEFQAALGGENRWLIRPFCLEEFKKAVFSTAKDRAPGPDGFSMAFLPEKLGNYQLWTSSRCSKSFRIVEVSVSDLLTFIVLIQR